MLATNSRRTSSLWETELTVLTALRALEMSLDEETDSTQHLDDR